MDMEGSLEGIPHLASQVDIMLQRMKKKITHNSAASKYMHI